MKIHEPRSGPAPGAKTPFSQFKLKPKPKAVAARAPTHALSPTVAARGARATQPLRELRRAQDARSAQLVSDRSEGLARNVERTNARAEELVLGEVRRELKREELRAERPPAEHERPADAPSPRAEPPAQAIGPSAHAPQASAPEAATARAAASVDSVLELVERIDWMMKAGRPALAVSVGGGLGAEVEIQRTGKDEVALTLVGRRGALGAHVLSQIREALGARGLRLSALRAG